MKPSDAINKLLAGDWTEAKIAESVGTTQPTINRIKHGATPSYDIGVAIVGLVAKQPATQQPEQRVG